MPFTTAHPAAAVPLAKWGMPLATLAIGSMAPDLPYFIPGIRDTHYGHTLSGFFLLSIPLGLLGVALFHALFKRPLLSLLPNRHQGRLGTVADEFRMGSLRNALMVLIGVFLGALTHIVWDSFTHFYGWPVQQIPLLRQQIGPFYVCKILQHGSSLVGTILLVVWYLRWFREAEDDSGAIMPWPKPTHRVRFWIGFALVALAVGLLRAIPHFEVGMGMARFRDTVARTAVIATGAMFILELILFSLFWQFRTIFGASPSSRQ